MIPTGRASSAPQTGWSAPTASGSAATTRLPRALTRTFDETDGYDELVVLRDIAFESHCEHHMAPIIGVAHVGYLPRERVVGIPSWPASSSSTPGACRSRRR